MKYRIKRLISQLIFLLSANLGFLGLKTGFCYPFFYCHSCPTATSACPLRALEESVYKGNTNWKYLFYPFMILGAVGSLTGRSVCGWACPIGLLQRGTSPIARQVKKSKFVKDHLSSIQQIDRLMRYAKYFILIGLIFFTSALIGFIFTDICPIGFLTGTIPTLLLYPGQFVPNPFFFIALVIFLLFLILIFTIERGWCRYVCPIGAILAPFNKIAPVHIDVDLSCCIHCNACTNVCPMAIDVPSMKRSPECILCGKCVDICPKDCITLRRR